MNRLTHILVAEDNEDDVFLLRQAFRKVPNAAMLHVVSDGAEAVDWLKGNGKYAERSLFPTPDLVLLDLNMPRLNGFEVLTEVRRDPRCGRTTVHMLTTSTRIDDVERAYELGANSYVIKPNRVDELVAFVAALHTWHQFACISPPSESSFAPEKSRHHR